MLVVINRAFESVTLHNRLASCALLFLDTFFEPVRPASFLAIPAWLLTDNAFLVVVERGFLCPYF